MLEKQPTSSVVVLVATYNHEACIRQALDSIFMQEINFRCEVVVMDDCSTDRNREIILEYKKKYPSELHLIFPDFNSYPTNCYKLYEFSTNSPAKYVAMLDGDDYWTDPLKLQKQVDVLEANPNIVCCHHWHKHVDEQGNDIYTPPQGYFPQKISTVEAILANKMRVKTRTSMFRNVLNTEILVPWMKQFFHGDVSLSIFLGQFGDFYFIDEEMAAYRITAKGVSSPLGNTRLSSTLKKIELNKELQRLFTQSDLLFEQKYNDVIDTTLEGLSQEIESTKIELSIIIYNYNNAEYLEQCIESILNQDYKGYEIIICDDCSVDDSSIIIEKYKRMYLSRFHVIYNNSTIGAVKSRHRGIEASQQKYITILDSTDYFENNFKLVKEMAVIDSYLHKGKDVIAFSRNILSSPSNEILSHHSNLAKESLDDYVVEDTYIIPLGFVMLRSTYFECGGYRKHLGTYENLDLILRLAQKYDFAYSGVAGTVCRASGNELLSAVTGRHPTALKKVFSSYIGVAFGIAQEEEKLTLDAFLASLTDFWKQLFFTELSCTELVNRIDISGHDIIIFGCGKAGKSIYKEMSHMGYSIAGFTDNNAKLSGDRIFGVEIIALDEIHRMKNVFILIASMYWKDIAEQLCMFGLIEGNNFAITI